MKKERKMNTHKPNSVFVVFKALEDSRKQSSQVYSYLTSLSLAF
ncbi:hypothetical protein NEOC65_002241 [Neochlamydia sp. AcF65]|nr:hypothetical protein [Neochlamydia sp. AcF65]MBS4169448.1 hypothetical protein [Neochlamydia sp. AcF95]